MVSFTKTVNSSAWDHTLFVSGKNIFTVAKVLDAVTGYTPAVGDLLVTRKDSSNEDDKFDFDFYSTSGSGTIDSAGGYLLSLGNTSLIEDPDDIISLVDSASATWNSAIGTTIGFVPGVPAYLDFDVTGTAVATAGTDMTFTFIEEDKKQDIQGVIYSIDSTDTANVTLKIATECSVHYSALGTDGTGTAAQIAKLKDDLRDINIVTRV